MTAKKPTRKAAKKRAVKKATPPLAPEVAQELPLAEKVRRMEVRNVLAKLNAGKTLSARENRLIESHLEMEDSKKSSKTQRMKDMVESQQAAAARIGCRVEEVKLAKALGCTAFGPSNRVTISELAEYLKTDEFKAAKDANLEDTTAADWDKRLKRAKALQAEHRLKIERSQSWDAEQAKMLFAAGDTAMSDTLRRYLESEQPPLVEGKAANEILKVNRNFLDDLLKELTASRVAAAEKLAAELPDDAEDDE